jgi:hypothetical protein
MAVVEICTFTTADDDALRAADARMQTEFAYQQPGMRRRTTARGEPGQWCVITLWENLDDAMRAEGTATTDGTATAFWSLVDAGSLRVQRFTTLE